MLADSVAATVTEIELPHLAMFTSTYKQYSGHLASAGLRLNECVDLSNEIANFLEDDNFEANLASLREQTQQTESCEQEHRSWFNFGQAVRKKLLRYVLLTVSPVNTNIGQELLISENCKGFELPVRYRDAVENQPQIIEDIWGDIGASNEIKQPEIEPQLFNLIETLGEAELDSLLDKMSSERSM